ncbi:MAG: SspB family protein [Rickettsiaceae bacterium]
MLIDYQSLIDEAMLGIVKKVLENTRDKGLTGDQCFYISFRTDLTDVILSKSVKKRYPKEITIVLQYQFKNLIVLEDRFSVNVAFGGVPETIQVPFKALTSFIDPSASFSLQFKQSKGYVDEGMDLEEGNPIKQIATSREKLTSVKSSSTKKQAGEIIALDRFRKKDK